ncbi:hypothetical protein GFS24_09480 [Chitinophaga sp. SYP-B3965]|uniref:hypothetical protein n=1 Tax=Chitinophaga sp. SYP-B3965 TaxID=2663120 RepID=UPI001299C5F5|nr:hypothetical protein [Chitinophaga sp. SYP-B3965]MRG45347.1 hypothetical protein [Chitinophaga sp. SYP-B3965]
MITPFKQMQFAFDKDCCFADIIFIIGYSFGDEHINECLKTALRHNSKLKIVIIDPGFLKNDLDFLVSTRLFPYSPIEFSRKTVSKDYHSYLNGTVTAHTLKFLDFLKLMNEEFKNPLLRHKRL